MTRLIFVLTSLSLAACGSLPVGMQPTNSEYCDNYLVYDMCARDMSGNGIVDSVYFTETKEVFMFRPGADSNIPSELGVHRCAMPMDEDLVATTSRLFYIDEETSFIEKQDIRGAMLIKYVAYMPEVTACNLRAEQAESGAETDS